MKAKRKGTISIDPCIVLTQALSKILAQWFSIRFPPIQARDSTRRCTHAMIDSLTFTQLFGCIYLIILCRSGGVVLKPVPQGAILPDVFHLNSKNEAGGMGVEASQVIP